MKARGLLIPVLAFTIGLVLVFHPVLFSGFGLIPGDPGDARLNNYILEHSFLWLTGAPAHADYWSPPFFFPQKNTGAYTDFLLSAAPFYWVFRGLGFLADTSFQAWLLVVTLLNFTTMYLYLRRCVRLEQQPAAFGAFLFAFGSPRIAQITHPQLTPHFFVMTSVYGLHRLFERGRSWIPRPAWISVFFLGAALQLWSGFYLGWFYALGVAILAAWALVFRDTRRPFFDLLRTHPVAILVSAAAAGLMVMPEMTHYVQASKDVGVRSFGNVASMIPTLQSWFYLGDRSWLYGWLSQLKPIRALQMPHEHPMGLGLLTGALAWLGLFRERKTPLFRLLLLVSLSVFVMVTREPFFKSTLWSVLFGVIPGASAVRALSRITIFMLIPLSIGASVALVRFKNRRWVWALLIVAVLEQAHLIPTYDKYRMRENIRQISSRIEQKCAAFFYSPVLAPGSTTPIWKNQVDAMWAELEAQVPTLNGYSGNSPPGWNLWDLQIRDPSDADRISHGLSSWTSTRGIKGMAVCWVKVPEN